MAVLVHLNGPPGVGKSTIAERLVARRPLALLLDIDSIRVQLGGWRERPESKGIARSLGLAMAEQHLRAGHDVVVPQLLVAEDQIERFRRVAVRAGAAYAQLVLSAPAAEIVARLRASPRGGVAHPRDEFTVDQLEEQVAHAAAALAVLATTCASTRLVDVGGLVPEDAADRCSDAERDLVRRERLGAGDQ